jgi:hypothetical protein
MCEDTVAVPVTAIPPDRTMNDVVREAAPFAVASKRNSVPCADPGVQFCVANAVMFAPL